jgi:hypothetical protein
MSARRPRIRGSGEQSERTLAHVHLEMDIYLAHVARHRFPTYAAMDALRA